jgi:DNA-binding response OmpR family regulator
MNDRQRIMVVDNDQEMLSFLKGTLKTEGFDTIVVADGDSVLTLLDELEPDLVILDSTMPGPEGFQTLDLMREHSDVPIIILTSQYDVESLRKALSHGADDYIGKPFGQRSFIARIRAALRRARQKIL